MPLTRFGAREMAIGTGAFLLSALALALAGWRFGSPLILAPLLILVPLYAWLLWFFRDPERDVPGGAGCIVSPADGVVTHVDDWNEPEFIGGPARRLSIFLSVLDVHLNRAPAAGRVAFRRFRPGAFFDARREESLTKNQNQDLGLAVEEPGLPAKMLIRQSTGAIARNIVCPAELGRRLERGERYGMIKFGSRTTLFLSRDAEVEWLVKAGDRVKAGATVVARALARPDPAAAAGDRP
jgi:phosphatidylserine decarboxylase